MEYLLTFHIISEHVQSWLKLDVLLETVHLTILQHAINANGHLFVCLSDPLVSQNYFYCYFIASLRRK